MKTILLKAIVLALISFPVGVSAGETFTGVVQIHSGPVRGTVDDGVRAYLGIPYAAPPVGGLRWKPPQEVASWQDPRTCAVFGPSCPQPNEAAGATYSEDCLSLNVWARAARPGEKLPVMVWIHGGAFNFGSGSLPEYNGRNLAKRGVVVVTINYRLGPLGFLVHPLLSKESEHAVSGNYGLLDQIAALGWVQRNIAAFGGDPDRVTLFGQSAGSRSVSLQMISPLSAGLFHGAIAQSGGPIIGSQFLSPLFNGDMAGVAVMGQRLATMLGCDKAEERAIRDRWFQVSVFGFQTGGFSPLSLTPETRYPTPWQWQTTNGHGLHPAEHVLAAMRAKPADEIVRVAACKTSVFDDSGLFFAPVFDGWVLPRDPLAAFRGGRQHAVPIIVGSTLNEGTTYLAGETDLSVDKYRSFLKSRFGEHAGQAFDCFPASEAKDVAPAIDRILTVGANAQPARLVAQSMARVKSKAYLYQFTRLPKTALARRLGVHHGVDLAYVFGNIDASDGYDDTDRTLSRIMMDYWVNFARTGNPNGPGLPDWPAYASATDINLEFSEAIHTNQGLFKMESDFIERTKGMRSDHATAEQHVADEHKVDPHAAHVRFRFQDQEMDFVFGSLILGATANKGCEIGEAFRTAADITDGDAASWQEAWIRTARLVEVRGEQSLAHGHAVSARDQFQRASNYYRAALVSMLPDDPRFRETALKSRELLKKAGTLFHPQLETIEIPFEGTVLPGYFRKAAEGKTPAGTLIMIGGAETFAEDLFFYIAPQAFDRGYNFLTVDLPGQGLLPLEYPAEPRKEAGDHAGRGGRLQPLRHGKSQPHEPGGLRLAGRDFQESLVK
ncbi:MAG: carboxylesterase family protein [Syntrophobacteraceae bacterium]